MKNNVPFFRIFPGDELRGPISGCSLAAQGLWFRLRIIMYDCEPQGYLCPGKTLISKVDKPPAPIDEAQRGKQAKDREAAAACLAGQSRDTMRVRHANVPVTCPSDVLVARMCGATLEELKQLVGELDEAGVTRYTVSGVMYCEELVEQASARAEWAYRKAKQRNLPFNGEQNVTRLSRESHANVPSMSPVSSDFIFHNKTRGAVNGRRKSQAEEIEEANQQAIEGGSASKRDR